MPPYVHWAVDPRFLRGESGIARTRTRAASRTSRHGETPHESAWCPPDPQVEFDADEVDGVVDSKEPVHGDGPDESPRGYQHPDRGDSFDDLGQRLEVGGEALNDHRQVDDQEVGRGRFAGVATIGTELAVELIEERCRNPDDPAISRHRYAER